MRLPQQTAATCPAKTTLSYKENTKRGARRRLGKARYALPTLLLLAAAGAAAVLPGPRAAAKKLVPSAASAPSPARAASVARADAPRTPASRAALLAPPVLFQTTAPGPLTLQTFAADCATPKTDWNLGETVCARVGGVTGASIVQLVNPSGYAVTRAEVGLGASDVMFTIPSDETLSADGDSFDNRGTWRVALVSAIDLGTRLSVPLTVHDPDDTVANLQVVKTLAETQAVAGASISALVRVYNAGPDAAANVEFTDTPPANTTFQSLTQTGGPAFNCTTPAVNTTGTAVCTAASLGRDVPADFVVTYKVNTNVANAAGLTSSASATTETTETSSNDNGSSDSATSSNPTPPACTMGCPENITVTAAPGQGGATVTFDDPTLGGTCGAVTSTPASGSFFAVGSTAVTSTVSGGQSCSFIVTVNAAPDTAAPTISCPSDITVNESSPSANSATVNYTVTAADDSGAVTVDCDPPDGSAFPAGTTAVRCTATDPAGNSAECTFNVTVNQTGCDLDANSAPPAPNAASLPTITRACSVTLLPTDDPSATDACGGTVNGDIAAVNGQPSAERNFDVPGTYTVTWSYTDGAGHVATQNQTIVILPDNSAPVPDAASLPTVTGECFAEITGAPPTATDDCGGSGVAGTPLDPLSYSAPGTYTVRWKFTDPAGNSAIQNQTVIVTDTHAPTLTLNGPSSVTVECHAPYADAGATATDNCSPAPTPTANGSVDVNTPGTYTVVWSATDAGGNTATATRTVTVVDTTAPVITLNGANTLTVECHTSFTDPGATASDSCDAGVPVGVSGAVNANVVGSYTLTYTASDDSGNAAAPVTRTVNVVDTTAPVVTLNGANPATVILGSSFSDPGATASDSCAGTLPVGVAGAVNTNAVGTYTLTYSATDASGNTGAATRTVKVIYNFSGFFSPVSNQPTVNQVNGGRSVPVKFGLAGNQGLLVLAAGSPYSQQVSCSTSAPISDVLETGTAGSSSLSYDASANQYVYVWKTESSWAGTCRVLTVGLIDGTTHAAYFKFK